MSDKKDDKKDDKKSGGGYNFIKDMKDFYKDISNPIQLFKLLGWKLFLGATLLLFIVPVGLNSLNMISARTGMLVLPPINVTKGGPTAELGKYPYHAESGMLVYFYSQGSQTERVPSGTTCWGLKLNEYANTIATYSSETTVSLIQGGCTFYSLTEVYSSIKRAYPGIGWTTMVDNQVVSSP